MNNFNKPLQKIEGVQALSAINSKNNQKFTKSDWANNASRWIERGGGW